jgi:phosphoribosylformylglycinamidine cyclo-ligase
MYHTFNMGVGMVLIVAPGAAKSIVAKFAKMKLKSWLIGEVIRGKKEVGVV